MKIVHTADWHIGKSINEYSLLEDQRYYFDKFIQKLAEIKPDILIIAGDLYDRSIPSVEATKLLNSILIEIVHNLKIKVFAIAGNHDSKERLSFGSQLLEDSGFYICGVTDKKVKEFHLKIAGQEVNIYMLPYFEPYHIKPFFPDEQIKTHDEAMKIYTKEAISSLDEASINILVGHGLYGKGDSEEITVGGSEMVDAAAFKVFDYVALGHLHNYRTAGSERMVFSGSPLKYSIDEASHNPSFCVVELEKNSFKLERVMVEPLRDVKVISGYFDSFFSDSTLTSNDYIFVNLTDSTIAINAISRLKAIFPNILGLRYINLKSAIENDGDSFIKSRSDKLSIATMSTLELFSDFYKAVKQEELTEKQMEYLNAIDISPLSE